MWFMNPAHKHRYYNLKARADRGDDPYYVSAIYALSAIDKAEISSYIDEESIHFNRLAASASKWSSAEKAMIDIAWELFNGGAEEKQGIHNCFRHLSNSWAQVAVNAIRMRYCE